MDTSASFMIPHIDPARYAYSQHPTYPHLYLRRAVGPETKWARQAPAYRQLYLTGHVTPLTKSTIQGAFFQAAKRAWMRMRFEYPEIVQLHSGRFYPDGSAIMQCEIPMDEAAARAWVGRTCHTVLDPVGVIGAMEVAEEAMRKRKFADPVGVILQATYSQSAEGKSTSTGAAFSMRVDHGLADGMGAYLLAGKYFRILGEELGGREEEQIDWKEAARRIPKCWVELLNEEQRTEGEDFEEAVRCNINLVMESTRSRWGIKFQPRDEYRPKSIGHTFSPSQSTTILRSIKAHLGPTYSITHLGHAAVTMTLLKSKPLNDRPLDHARLVSLLFVNGRRYLDSTQPKTTDHIPMCRAMSAIEFRDVERYIYTNEDTTEEVRAKLKIACEEARRSYQRIREQKSLLTESFSVAEVMATVKNDVKAKGMADPFFLSDGIIEQYTPRSYLDPTATHETLTLDDIHFTANPDGPPVIVRMSTFRGSIRFSAEWNGALYPEGVIEGFLGGVVELMGTFIDE